MLLSHNIPKTDKQQYTQSIFSQTQTNFHSLIQLTNDWLFIYEKTILFKISNTKYEPSRVKLVLTSYEDSEAPSQPAYTLYCLIRKHCMVVILNVAQNVNDLY